MQEKVTLQRSEVLFNFVEENQDIIVLFLPGISGGAHSERFEPFVELSNSLGYTIGRIRAWENVADVETKSFDEYHETLSEVFEEVRKRGFKSAVAIGKSFGGALFLSHHDDFLKKKILLAPAVSVGESANFDEIKFKKLSEFDELLEISLSKKFVSEDSAEIAIIHGTEDEMIPIGNSQLIVESAKDGSLVLVEGASHSFRTKEEEKSLLEETRKLLVRHT